MGKTVDENSFWGTAILLYIENTSGQNVGINAVSYTHLDVYKRQENDSAESDYR